MNIFETMVNELRGLNYDVDKIAADLTSKTIFGLEAEGTAKAEMTKQEADVKMKEAAEFAPQKSSLSIPSLAENLNTANKSPKIEDIKHDVPSLTTTK